MNGTRILLFLSILAAIGRLLVPGHNLSGPGTYEAMVHIFVGVLGTIAVYYFVNEMKRPFLVKGVDGNAYNPSLSYRILASTFSTLLYCPAAICFMSLTVLELYMFQHRH